MFKQTLDKAITKKENKEVIVNKLATQYSITKHEVHQRIRSYYGVSLETLLTPTRKEFIKCIMFSSSIDELKGMLGLSIGLGKLYEKYLGVSTYSKAKIACEKYREVTPYNPSSKDNKALLVSQYLGDGHLSRPRKIIDIQHGEKQCDYLIDKVRLINKGYPETQGIGTIAKYKHKQGHTYYRWYSGKMKSYIIDSILDTPKEVLVNSLTPLGICLWYLDDGCLTHSVNHTHLKLAISDPKIRGAACEMFLSYGIVFSSVKDNIIISNTVGILDFLNCFTKPFKHLISKCMWYKMELMI